MATLKLKGAANATSHADAVVPTLRWTQILAISIFWFALNFHWAALGFIILPSQVLKIAGELHKGQALAFVLVPGAFVALFTNPLFGLLSDRTRGNLAIWGRRRPYILLGTLVNVGALCWMAMARDIPSLVIAYVLVQFSSNVATAPFHALLPDLVPQQQRGMTSGIMGMLSVAGTMCGVAIASVFVDAHKPVSVYHQGLLFAYGCIVAFLLVFMLITLFSVDEYSTNIPTEYQPLLTRKTLYTLIGITLATLILWGLIVIWNSLHMKGAQIPGDVEQGVLMVVLSLGILRLFGFDPRRNRDFAWVLVTRLVMMLGIYTIQSFIQYYMHDVVGIANPEQETTKFVIIASLMSLISALAAGWLSDQIGRKRVIYLSGGLIAALGVAVIITQMFTHALPVIYAAGALFGIGAGAYQSVDWALVADVLPSRKDYARDMGIWNISLSLPQVIAPVIGGPLIDAFAQRGMPAVGFQVLFAMAVVYCLIGTITVRYIRHAG